VYPKYLSLNVTGRYSLVAQVSSRK